MLFGCFSSCARCLSPRWERRTAARDTVTGPDSVPVPIPAAAAAAAAPEAVPGAAQMVRTANGDIGGPEEPPFEIRLGIFTSTGGPETIQATVDHSLPLNVVTSKCLKQLGFDDPFERPLPPDLSELAAEALPGPYGWCTLSLYASVDKKSLSLDVGFVVVDDDDRRGLLLGREFKGVKLEPGIGIFPNYAPPKSKEDRERDERERKRRQAAQAEEEVERKRQAAKRLDQQRKGDPKSGRGAGEGTSA